jgi:CubicO group peptidase (beta-lactamase class C family)
MMTMSSVKSWTSLFAGILIAAGKLRMDDPVSRYLPEWKAGSQAGVTIQELLSMTSGLARRREASGPSESIGFVSSNKDSFVTSLPLDYQPGQRWDYSNEGVQLLSLILQRAAGMPLHEFARQRLFEPLHMDHTRLHVDGAGVVWAYADAETSLRDFAKPCQLMLNGGQWNKVQVVPQSWVRRATQPIRQNAGYGLLWWIVPGGFAAEGYLDTSCYVQPQLGLVVARMQSKPAPEAKARYRTPALFDLFRSIVRR